MSLLIRGLRWDGASQERNNLARALRLGSTCRLWARLGTSQSQAHSLPLGDVDGTPVAQSESL